MSLYRNKHGLEKRQTRLPQRGSGTFGLFFQRNPKRRVILGNLIMAAEQSVILASLPHSTNNLEMHYGFAFEDGGNAFFEALQNRRSTFGALKLEFTGNTRPDAYDFMERLLQAPNIKTLTIKHFDWKNTLIPFVFSSPLKRLAVSFRAIGHDRSYVNVAANAMVLTLGKCFRQYQRADFLGAFFRQVAELTQIVECRLRFDSHTTLPLDVERDLIHFILSNPKLQTLELGHCMGSVKVLQELLTAVANLKSIRTLTFGEYPFHLDGDFSLLQQLLHQNNKIKVLNKKKQIVTDGNVIDQACLVREAPLLRLALVGKALMENVNATDSSLRSARLLLNHTDVLCDLLQGVDMEENEISDSVNGESGGSDTLTAGAVISETFPIQRTKRKAASMSTNAH